MDERAGRPSRRRALRSRLAVLFAAAVAVVITLAVALLALAADHQFDNAIGAALDARTTAVSSAVARGDLQAVRADPLAQLLDPDGTVASQSISLDPVPPSAHQGRGAVLLSAQEIRRAADASPSDPLTTEEALPGLQGIAALRGRVRISACGVATPTGRAVLVIGSRLDPVYDAEGRLLLLFVLGAPPLVLLLGVAGWLLAAAALRPVAALTARASQISAADVDQRLPQPPGTDEIAELARTLNRMLARVADGVRREREFVDDAAHELRTPIAVLRAELELALRRGARVGMHEDVAESITSALDEARRLSRLAEDLLALASAERSTGSRTTRDLLELVDTEVDRLRGVQSVSMRVQGESVHVRADAHEVGRLLANLVTNAQAAGARQVLVLVGRADVVGDAWGASDAPAPSAPPRAGQAMLRVDDDGPGFPPSLLATATERFTRADPARTRAGGGAGLGLAIVAAVARASGGEVVLLNGGLLGGASVRVVLPAHPRTAGPVPGGSAPPSAGERDLALPEHHGG